MQTIKMNGKEMKVSAGEERILRTLARSNFIAGKDNFVEGTGNHQRSLLQHANLSAIGVREVPKEYPKTNAEIYPNIGYSLELGVVIYVVNREMAPVCAARFLP